MTDGHVSQATLAKALEAIDPAFKLEDVRPVDRGRSRIYRLSAVRSGTAEELLFKAAPADEGEDPGIPADGRLLALLSRETSIPVPTVLGIFDDHPSVPAPSFVMREMDGETAPYEAIGRLSDGTIGSLAAGIGSHLGELHRVDCIDSYGHVTRSDTDSLRGGVPDDPAVELAVTSGIDSWPAFERRWLDRELRRHADSRFGSLTPDLRAWADERLGEWNDPVGPVLGRNDHGLHNLLLAPGAGEVTAVLDWGYTLGVAPAFDFEYAAYLYSGAFLAGLPDVADRRDLVRRRMLAGYRSSAPDLAAAVSTPRPLYELLAMVRVMNDFELLDLPDGTREQVATRLEADAKASIGTGR